MTVSLPGLILAEVAEPLPGCSETHMHRLGCFSVVLTANCSPPLDSEEPSICSWGPAAQSHLQVAFPGFPAQWRSPLGYQPCVRLTNTVIRSFAYYRGCSLRPFSSNSGPYM